MTSRPYPMSNINNSRLNTTPKSRSVKYEKSIISAGTSNLYTYAARNGVKTVVTRKEFEIKQKALNKLRGQEKTQFAKCLDKLFGNKQKIYCSNTAPSADEGQCFRSTLDNVIFTNDFVRECETYFISKVKPYQYQSAFENIKQCIRSKMEDINNQDLIKLVEDLMLFLKFLFDAKSKKEYAMAIFVFAKLRMGDKPIVNSDFFTKLTTYFNTLAIEYQSDDDGLTYFTTLREMLSKYNSIKTSPFIIKIYKFSMYALSLSLFSKVGLSMDNMNYTKMEQAAIKAKYHLGPDFIHCLLDTLLFLSERGYQCLKTGTMSPLFHSDRTYGEWFDSAQRLKDQSRFSHNFALGNVCEFKFRAELDEIIEKGESIAKFAFDMDAMEKGMVRKFVNELWMIKVDLMTKKAAKESRTPPFSILISGDSSIGKSSIMEMLYTHFGKREKLPIDCEYKYTRNAAAKFWDGFTTSQWCIIFDDVAFMHPNKAPQGDPTLMEIIQLINAVPFTPDQASLNDKGNTPVRAKLVVASTNTEDLNAHYYFACPSAVQRRFPYIIEPIVRREFMADDGKTLDSSKCVQIGDYPDYWVFNVKKVIATPKDASGKHGKATMKNILQCVDLRTFLQWFNNAIIEHNRNQDCVKASLDTVSNAVLCERCGLPTSMCDCEPVLQSNVTSTIYYLSISWFCSWFSAWFMNRFIGFYYLIGFFRETILGRYMYDYLYRRISQSQRGSFERISFKNLGKCMEYSLCIPPLLVYISVYLSSLIAVNSLRTLIINYIWGAEEEADSADIGTTPKVDTEVRENVWYKNNYELSSFDYSKPQNSAKSLTLEAFSKTLHNNIVHLKITAPETGKYFHTGAICLKGNIYMMNAHAVPKENIFEVFIIRGSSKDGVCKNVTTVLYKHNILILPNDIAIFEINCLPPCKSIVDYFAKSTFTGVWNGMLLTRSREGLVSFNYAKKIHKCEAKWLDGVTGNHWEYTPETSTKNGDCGGLIIAEANKGFVIVGIHYSGIHSSFTSIISARAAALDISSELIELHLKQFDRQFEPSVPAFESETANVKLIELHSHSPIRFIEQGACNVYGSLAGFRSEHKSTVTKSIMCKYMVDAGFKLKYTVPSMRGWQPKRKALLDIMSMEHRFDTGLLDNIVADFAKGIISSLGDKINILQVYDDFTAVNGAAGVTYVDKINRNTSMGFPWRMSKKYHMKAMPAQGGNQDPVAMSDEIMKRVSNIITKYQNEELYHPVFTAALKDEPVTPEKASQHATRVFMGAPVDWSIVVRKYCLSFIKLIQSNRTIFECGAGTIAQSDEWHNYRVWLTSFGEDRIVAGDYSKFDKRMGSEIILAAFKLMTTIMKASDMTDDEIRVVEGIARDTAFPMVDYFGDLMQFNGCNPSGHPLTVIINSLANSLYMRYCYYILNPEHEIETFQDNIHLMTYGDDNIMGVSPHAPWFNHTAIAGVLNTYGVKYTMAEKTAESVPYIHINDASFLKRKWTYCEELKRYLCTLDEDSIIKSLMIWVPSKTICAEQQSIAIMNSAVMEYFFYGKDTFELKRTFFLEMIKDLKLELFYEGNEFPTWQDLVDRYKAASIVCPRPEEPGLNQTLPPKYSLLSDIFAEVSGNQ